MTVDKSFMLYHDKGIYFTPPQLKRRECRYREKAAQKTSELHTKNEQKSDRWLSAYCESSHLIPIKDFTIVGISVD